MKKLKLKKVMVVILIVLILLSTFSNFANASTPMNTAFLYKVEDCTTKLRYWSDKQGKWLDVICYYTEYEENGVRYPAYCLNPNLGGVGEYGSYSVDVATLLDNEVIWRTIANGYPYKTPQELGVDTVLDAYLVTKRAVHSNLYNRDVRACYVAFDENGERVIDAIERLTNIGRYGTQTRDDDNMTIKTVGDMYQEGNYYIQKFRVDSNVEVANYTITATPNMPSGGIVTNANGVQTNTFNGEEYFFVKIPKESMVSNISTVISIQGKCKTYPIYYGVPADINTQDYALTFDPYEDLIAATSFDWDIYKSGIIINKVDEETKTPLAGVTFNAKYQDGTAIGDFTTNEQGKITINNLKPGKVILTEVVAREEYILDATPIEVELEYAQTKTVELTNKHKKGNLKVYKVDKDNHRITLGNVEFDLYSEEFQKVIGTYTTDVNGEIQINDLRTGKYKLIEKKTGQWYNLAEDTNVVVKWNTTEENTIENELKKGQIRVIKVDKDNNEVKLAGVKFDVLDENGNVLETIITDENGEALTRRFVMRDYSKITIREKETLENYVLSEETQTIILEENQIKNITFENELIKGNLEITKVDSKTKEKLSGATFGIYDENDNEIAQITTDETGIATIENLAYGKYYAKELDTGSVYYFLNENTYEFEIKENKVTVPLTIENDGVNIEVDVEKEGTIEIKPGEKVNYEFSNIANKSNIYLDNFKWFDYIPTDYIRLEKMTTGTWNQDLTYSVFYKTNKSEDYILFKDNLSTKENYELDFKTIEFSQDEYITETCFEFGKVEVGFKEDTSPTMECISFDTLKDGQTFTNHTKTVGTYYDMTAEADSKWTTITHTPEEKTAETLPRTGK